jgi:putative ABC transport system permease protein
MIRNYFTVAFRNFRRNKVFSTINVLGLSIGISAALVIFLIVYYEFSFDKFENDNDRIYRVVMDVKFNGDEGHSPAVPAPLGNAIQTEVSGVEATVPVMQFQGDATAKVSVAENNADKLKVYKKQTEIIFTNNQYFELIPHQWIAGSQQVSLQSPFSVVLTQSRAQQYFPGIAPADIIGKQLTYNDELKTTVTGIVKDLNAHTDFTAVEFISFPTISQTHLQENFMMNVWNDWMAYSKLYIKLSKGNTAARTEMQLKNLLKKYNKDANKDDKNTMAFKLQPLSDIHFNTDYAGFGQRTAHRQTLYSLLAIAVFLLLLGCINFINLTTAQASQRAKEIGIRKTIGSSKKQLMLQFLSETFFITVVATIVSVLITPVLLKMFADFIPQGLHFDIMHEPSLIIFLILLTIVVSFLSGLYPALILSAHKPVSVLKNQASSNSGQTRNAWIRKTLTVSQFVIAQFFIIGTFMVSKQIHYTLNKDLGFKKEAILNFELPFDTVKTHSIQLLNEIKAIPEIQLASIGFEPPAMEGAAFGNLKYNDGKKDIKENVQVRWGDSNYIKLYQIKLLAGRNVRQGDSVNEYLINNTYAKDLGFQHPEDAINKQLINSQGKNVPIVGVMQDFHEQSLHGLIGPIVFQSNNTSGGFFHIKLKPQNAEGTVWPAAIAKLTLAYKKMYPAEDFNYSFFDESIAKFYESEQQTSRLLKWATGLAILISCLGLLGLVIYTTNIRTKEIGIRKILGASVTNIVSILSKDFVRLLIIAFAIAAPIAWWAANSWLQNFAYRTTLSWWVFALSGFAMIAVALFTLSIQIIRAATTNPVNSLRTD